MLARFCNIPAMMASVLERGLGYFFQRILMSTITVERAIQIFEEAKRPFCGRLIGVPNDPSVECPYCAQGLVLHNCGISDDHLRKMEQSIADKKVAQLLGISLFESVLLRTVNDSKKGCPQDVLILTDEGIGSLIGPHWKQLVSFARSELALGSVWELALESGSESGSGYWRTYYAITEIKFQDVLKKDYDFKFLKTFGFNSPKEIPLTV